MLKTQIKRSAILFLSILSLFIQFSCKSHISKTTHQESKAIIEKPHPTRVGQKFTTSFGDEEILTVAGFHGSSGITYPTYEEAKINDKDDGRVIISNKEYGGASSASGTKS